MVATQKMEFIRVRYDMKENNSNTIEKQECARIIEEYFIRYPSLHPIHVKALIREILDN